MTQNPPCNTLATVQTSNIKRPDPRVTHHDFYPKFDCNPTTKGKTRPSFVEKSLFNKTTSWHCVLLEAKTLELIVLLSLSLFSLTKQVSTTGTSSDLSTKVWVTAYKGDAYSAVNTLNLRHAFTLNKRITLSYADRSSHAFERTFAMFTLYKVTFFLKFLSLTAKFGQNKNTNRIKIKVEVISKKKIVLEHCYITEE